MSEQPTTVINNQPAAHSADHDLLLTFKAEVSTKLDRVITDVKDLKDDLVARVTDVEREKLNKAEFDTYSQQVEKGKAQAQRDFEDYKKETQNKLDAQQEQIDFANNWIRYGLGALGLLNFALAMITVIKLFF